MSAGSDSSDIEFDDDDAILEQRRQQMLEEAKNAKSQPQKQGPEPRPKTDDEIFREAFDPTSPSYHKGIQTAVPLGGSRIPEGMEAHANWREMPEVEPTNVNPEEFGPEAAKIWYQREDLNEFKKALSAPLPFVAALVTNTPQLEAAQARAAANPSDEQAAKEAMRLTGLVQSNRANLAASLAGLRKWQEKYPPESGDWGVELADVVQRISAPSWTKEEHQEVIERSKRLGSKIFMQRNKLLQDWKKAKAAYIASQKK